MTKIVHGFVFIIAWSLYYYLVLEIDAKIEGSYDTPHPALENCLTDIKDYCAKSGTIWTIFVIAGNCGPLVAVFHCQYQNSIQSCCHGFGCPMASICQCSNPKNNTKHKTTQESKH